MTTCKQPLAFYQLSLTSQLPDRYAASSLPSPPTSPQNVPPPTTSTGTQTSPVSTKPQTLDKFFFDLAGISLPPPLQERLDLTLAPIWSGSSHSGDLDSHLASAFCFCFGIIFSLIYFFFYLFFNSHARIRDVIWLLVQVTCWGWARTSVRINEEEWISYWAIRVFSDGYIGLWAVLRLIGILCG